MSLKRFYFWGPLSVLLLLSYFSLFHQLGKQPMHLWDETCYAFNAQEMIERGNPIEVYRLGEPDLFNSKPPFAIWCMATSIKILGFNELGVRMASAIFAFLSVLLLWLIGIKTAKNNWIALIFPLVLISSSGFVGFHVSRTGDTDSILAFWILLQSVFILGYTNADSKKRATYWLILFGLALSFGCLTKGIAGLVAIPGIAAWVIYKGKLVGTFQNKGFYIALLSFLILVIGYYCLRSYLTPGYFDAVLENEIGGRFRRQDALNPTPFPFYFYFQNMITNGKFYLWIILLPISILYIFISKADIKKNMGVFFIFIFGSISILLALSKTKFEWYDAPLYPLMAAIIGISISIFLEQIGKKFGLLFICIFCWPFYKIVSSNIYVSKKMDPSLGVDIGSFIRKIRAKGHEKDSIYIINTGENCVIDFYIKQDWLNGYFCDVITQNDSLLTPGKHILTQQLERDIDVNAIFNLEPILRYKNCAYYRIINKK